MAFSREFIDALRAESLDALLDRPESASVHRSLLVRCKVGCAAIDVDSDNIF